MDLARFINFCGWAALTYTWLQVNATFVAAIGEAIRNHNQEIIRHSLEEQEEDSE